jgi:hypothetical protein
VGFLFSAAPFTARPLAGRRRSVTTGQQLVVNPTGAPTREEFVN